MNKILFHLICRPKVLGLAKENEIKYKMVTLSCYGTHDYEQTISIIHARIHEIFWREQG